VGNKWGTSGEQVGTTGEQLGNNWGTTGEQLVILYWEFLGNDLEPNMYLGPRFGTPIWDPDLGPRFRPFGTPIWDPDLGPRFGTPIYDPDLGP
jgi:hypothetical protein